MHEIRCLISALSRRSPHGCSSPPLLISPSPCCRYCAAPPAAASPRPRRALPPDWVIWRMEALPACVRLSLQPRPAGASTRAAPRPPELRRSSQAVRSAPQEPQSSHEATTRPTREACELSSRTVLLTSKRNIIAFSAFCFGLHSSRYFSALALGDPSVKIEDITPKIFPSGPLFPTEKRIAELFETNTYSVVNIFDATLRPQLNVTGVVEIPEGNGSGIVWDESGHIVTNYHVVGNALSKNPKLGEVVARVNILAAEGIQKNFEGKLVGADRSKDLAVLKVDAPSDLLKPIIVGQSSALKVGQQCLAIGNPFGFDHTLTVGVISGLNRDIFSQAGVTIGGGIQTDAAINPGNSGGPLLDSKGHMIGINTAIFTQTGTSAGVGFAIQSSTILKIVPQLIQSGKVRRAGLNVEFAPDPIAYQLNVRNGALILKVPAGSAVAKAGLVPTSRGFAGNIVLGDVIVAVDGKPVKGKSDLMRVLDDYSVGDEITLTVIRGTKTIELALPLEESSDV